MDNERNIGVTADVRAKMKLGMFYFTDILFLLGGFGITYAAAQTFPPGSSIKMLIFYLVGISLTVTLIVPAYGHPKKRNYEVMLAGLFPVKRSFDSFDYDEFTPATDLLEEMKGSDY